MYQPGQFTQFVEAVKADVKRGIFSKEEATQIILKKAQDILSSVKVEKDQFMLDRMAEAQEVN